METFLAIFIPGIIIAIIFKAIDSQKHKTFECPVCMREYALKVDRKKETFNEYGFAELTSFECDFCHTPMNISLTQASNQIVADDEDWESVNAEYQGKINKAEDLVAELQERIDYVMSEGNHTNRIEAQLQKAEAAREKLEANFEKKELAYRNRCDRESERYHRKTGR